MSRRPHLFLIIVLAVGLMITVLVWRTAHDGEFRPDSSLLPLPVIPHSPGPSLLLPPTSTLAPTHEPLPPTGAPPVTEATLEALLVGRSTATPPAPGGTRLPYISPATWRNWALRVLALAIALAYVGLHLRRRRG